MFKAFGDRGLACCFSGPSGVLDSRPPRRSYMRDRAMLSSARRSECLAVSGRRIPKKGPGIARIHKQY